jgi:hypothetical protein
MIKNGLVIFMLVGHTAMNSVAQPLPNSLLPRVDERIELMSIAYLLARPGEFDKRLNPIYSKAIADHFSRYSEHPFIGYFGFVLDSLNRSGYESGYWDGLALAVHLSQPPQLQPLVLMNHVSSDDWDTRYLLTSRFVSHLQRFYKDTQAGDFFKSQREYYLKLNAAFEKRGPGLNRIWFDEFFGLLTTESYYAIPALCLSEGAYLRVNHVGRHRDTFTVFGCAAADTDGIPLAFADPSFSRMMLHEYLHAFTNQLVDENTGALQESAEVMIANPVVFGLMKDTFYGNWKYLLYESMVRSCGIRYMMANEADRSIVENEITKQEKAGFFWIRGLVDKLGDYEERRDKYPDLRGYMPELILYFKESAVKISEKK